MHSLGVNLLVWSGSVGAEERRLFPQIKAMGYDGVEIPIFDPHDIDVAATHAALTSAGLACTTSTALPSGFNLIDPGARDKTVYWLQNMLDVAAQLGAGVLCGPMLVPVGELRGRGYLQQEWQTCVGALQEVGRHAAACEVTLALEPLNRFETFMINTTTDGVRLMDEVDCPAVGLLLDTFHMNIEEKATPAAIRHAAPHVKHFHCSENDRGIVGSGQVPWVSVFETLDDIDYRGWLVVESFNGMMPELAGATCIWRPPADSPESLAQDSLSFIQTTLQTGNSP